ncbi:MAG: hypothetical protein JW866_03450 [Ignavibacteriales bacterium]|nr:hypothetical protein [Ignavibacteriales bacterium]
MNGRELGEIIKTEYLKINDELIDILNKENDTSKLFEQINALKDKTIEKFVEYGKEREKLSEEEKNACNNVIVMMFSSMDMQKFNFIHGKVKEFWNTKIELSKLIQEFNIITQYCDFDLLKKQKPDEAKRLGL